MTSFMVHVEYVRDRTISQNRKTCWNIASHEYTSLKFPSSHLQGMQGVGSFLYFKLNQLAFSQRTTRRLKYIDRQAGRQMGG